MSKIKIDKNQVESVLKHYPNEDSILVTSDGNVFLSSGIGKNFCRDHCKRVNAVYALLTRADFDNGVLEIEAADKTKEVAVDSDETPKKSKKKKTENPSGSTPSWKDGKWDEVIAFAKESGLEVTTKMNQGKEALIAEVESFIASKEIGANAVTNHIEE